MKILVALLLVSSSAYAGTCSSDFNCTYGQKCVKDAFKIEGTCMDVVNNFKVKQFVAPEIDSIKMKTSGCTTNYDCESNEQCYKNSSASFRGTCIRR